jgi:hypothetical protein
MVFDCTFSLPLQLVRRVAQWLCGEPLLSTECVLIRSVITHDAVRTTSLCLSSATCNKRQWVMVSWHDLAQQTATSGRVTFVRFSNLIHVDTSQFVIQIDTSNLQFSRPGQSMWGLWWTKWHWDTFFSEFFGFTLSGSFYRCSIFTHVSSEGWTKGPLEAAVPQRHSLTPSEQ